MTSKVVSIEDRIPKLKEQRKKKNGRRLLFFLIIFFLVVITVIYFQSPLSKVGTTTVTGNKLISEEHILHTIGLSTEKSIWSVNKDGAEETLLKIPEIKKAEVSILFPNKVHIEVEEYEIIGILVNAGKLSPVLENGEIIHEYNTDYPFYGPILKGFSSNELLTLTAKELNKLNEDVYHSVSEIIYSPKTTDQNRVVIYMNDGYEVHATLRTLSERLNYYPALVKQLDPDLKGILDLEVGLFFRSYDSIIELQAESAESGEEVED